MKYALIIAGMVVVTYIPRLLPFVALDARRFPPVLKRFLSYVPYAALGALIVPAAFVSVDGNIIVSAVAVITAAVVAGLSRNVALTLLASVGAAVLALMIGL